MNHRILSLTLIAIIAGATAWAVGRASGEAATATNLVPQPTRAKAAPLPLEQRILSESPAMVDAAVAEYRARGQQGLEAVLELRDGLAAKRLALLNREAPAKAANVAALASKQDASASQATPANGPSAQIARLDGQIARLDDAIDRVSGQRYGSISRLFWHTDLAQAEAAAAANGKPILSLRMLGNLTEDYSCANSRFFRTVLYSNKEISDYLRANFILHWKSQRPVPKVTIDFGDGRVLERTLTGNSIHYILDSAGQPLDGLPGLCDSATFLSWLKRGNDFAEVYALANSRERAAVYKEYHDTEGYRLATQWDGDLRAVSRLAARTFPAITTPRAASVRNRIAAEQGAPAPQVAAATPSVGPNDYGTTPPMPLPPPPPPAAAPGRAGGPGTVGPRISMPTFGPEVTTVVTRSGRGSAAAITAVPASVAGRIAMTKAGPERPMLARLELGQPPGEFPGPAILQTVTVEENRWRQIAARHPVQLDPVSVELITRLAPNAQSEAKDPAEGKTTMLDAFREAVALDTVRNEYILHRQLHEWMGQSASAPAALETLNERVYSELFLTPSSDPWLGLSPTDAYSALPNNGVAQAK